MRNYFYKPSKVEIEENDDEDSHSQSENMTNDDMDDNNDDMDDNDMDDNDMDDNDMDDNDLNNDDEDVKKNNKNKNNKNKLIQTLVKSSQSYSESGKEVLFMGFNEDYKCFFCGTGLGFYVYNTDPFKERFHRILDGGIGIIEVLGKSNIVALVGGGHYPKYSPTKVVIWDDYQNKSIAELDYSTEVKAIRCRGRKILVVLYNKVKLYNFENLSLEAEYSTYSNSTGLCAFSLNNQSQVLAIPGSKAGDLRIEHLDTKKTYAISAHKNALSFIALSQDGKLCATTSARGTLIRIWDTSTGKLFRELRRGIEKVNVISLAFNQNNSSICLSSDKGTVHVYSLIPKKVAQYYEKNKKSTFSFMGSYLPNYFSSEWSLTSFTIPGNRSGKCAFSPLDRNVLIIITTDRKLYQYRLVLEQNIVQLINTESIE